MLIHLGCAKYAKNIRIKQDLLSQVQLLSTGYKAIKLYFQVIVTMFLV